MKNVLKKFALNGKQKIQIYFLGLMLVTIALVAFVFNRANSALDAHYDICGEPTIFVLNYDNEVKSDLRFPGKNCPELPIQYCTRYGDFTGCSTVESEVAQDILKKEGIPLP